MEISETLRVQLLDEIEEAHQHFRRAAQIVSDECSADEFQTYRVASKEPTMRFQKLLDVLRAKT